MKPTQHTSDDSWRFAANNEAETERLGGALGEVLEAGSVIGLIGDLGAGKTRLVQAIAAGMGVERQEVNSPTFVLIQEYEGRLTIYHFDAYRLADTDEFLELGADELMAADGVCLIEWADRVADVLPADSLHIDIQISGSNSRLFQFTATGQRSVKMLKRLQTLLHSDEDHLDEETSENIP